MEEPQEESQAEKEIYADFVVIGSGPSGQKAAIQAAKLNKKVFVIEKAKVGGFCLYSGTIPSKTLREAVLDLTRFYDRNFYGKDHPLKEVSINDLNHRLNQVMKLEEALILKQFEKNNINIIYGSASFEDEFRLLVHDKEGKLIYRILFDFALICTGSKPRNPIHVPFDKQVILDSTRILSIDKVPATMLVLGGGIIGSEYASLFAALGTEVTVVDKREQMLPLLDSEIGILLQKALVGIGLKFLKNKKPIEIIKKDGKAQVTFEDGTVLQKDVVLYALGRGANVEFLNLQKIGLSINVRGYIPVNDLFQTHVPHIYAVGDVIGGPSLASTGMEQGRLAARHAFGVKTHQFPENYPIGIYTIPEISSCGNTEENLKKVGFNYEVGRAYYYEIGRGHISGSSFGLIKIIFHADTLEILGVHIIGRSATELVHIGQVAMSFNAHLDYFINQVFNYPTFAEGYRIAALNGMNKIKHTL